MNTVECPILHAAMDHDFAAQSLELPPTQFTKALAQLIHPQLRSSDISVTNIVGTLSEAISFPASGPATFSITLVLSGIGRAQIDGVEPLDILSGSAVIFWSGGPVSGQDHLAAGEPVEAVEIRFQPDYLQRTLGPMVDVIRNSLAIDRSNPSQNAYLVSIPMSGELFDVARTILGCDIHEQSLRDVFMRGKALEALALTLSVLHSAGPDAVRLNAREREKIDTARKILDGSFAEPWTIQALASRVGLSETKLKTGFRELIGTSVRAYLRDVRMDQAERLLGEGKSVTEAALACGYGNLSYFSKAFFNAKGIAPRRLSAPVR
ncbi:AraC family transcriptional regulator [Hyphomicrobium sp. LHD-15]|uniref:AraC family transcriptional regulator n=1 Tax=Hyphomicrobium sp. LHD-15 TaxID=3072142 RepID=UPI00280E1D03|nr:AraC family transcriptional regulator [Hyphomicrobium sp. LHD-15]MDQ8699225.1 AraC family transcriptional regulator [Hyphomicrobium sp. LHD-15]